MENIYIYLLEFIEISRDEKYNIEIKDIRFTEEFISKSSKEYIKYLNDILQNNLQPKDMSLVLSLMQAFQLYHIFVCRIILTNSALSFV